jgi:hypothetical protein
MGIWYVEQSVEKYKPAPTLVQELGRLLVSRRT